MSHISKSVGICRWADGHRGKCTGMPKKLSKEEQLQKLVKELYDEYDRVVTPIYPRIFIRVLPKETTYGSIVLPDHQQNKVQWEGMVLATYESFWRKLIDSTESRFRRDRIIITTENEKRVLIESSVKPGDHILFPYHVGIPDPVFDAKKYRIISENDVSAVLSYKHPSPIDTLREIIGQDPAREWCIATITEKFDLVRKNVMSKTRSGA
jgi:co-chaperonin GroES (HSP10)